MLQFVFMKENITILHNPRCSKSRCAIDLLKEKQLSFEILDYMQHPLTKEELTGIIEKLGIHPEELIRKGEAEYKEHFKGKNLTDAEWIDAMLRFPKLIERPVVIKGIRAVIGRPTENILNIL